MRDLLDKYLFAFPRNADAGAGGDGGAGAGDGAGDPPPAGAGDADPGTGGSSGDGTPPAAEGPYFPEGLAENLRGKDERETMDRMSVALKGYRDRDANRDLPEKPEGYFSLDGIDEKAFKLDDKFKPYLEKFPNDPGWKAAAAAAQKHGIQRPAFLEATQAAMAALSDAGMLEPMVDAEAERAALLPEAAKTLPKDQQDAAIDQRMNDNLAFVDLLVANRGLPKEAGEYAQLMLADSAKGHQFLEGIRNLIQGGGSGPGMHGQGGGGGSITHAQLKERQADERNNPSSMKFDPDYEADTSRLYREFVERGGKFQD